MHPSSLFSHFLHCSSSPCPIRFDLLPQLNYTETLNSSDSSKAESGFLQTLHGSDSELCFSLDDFYSQFGFNFFYNDCHGVVNLSALDGISRTFTLPVFLSVECANFVSNNEEERKSFERKNRKILPSELWAIRAEIEAWNEYPNVYSYRVLYAILGLDFIRDCDLASWVIANSPQYGVVIDTAMRDHIFLLCRLCLKAIIKEALNLVGNCNSEKILDSMNFSCPILVQALMWLASQLSILYGERNGKFFALNILKQCVLDAASGLVFFSLEKSVNETPALEEVPQSLVDSNGNGIKGSEVQKPLEIRRNGEVSSVVEESFTSGVILVSQLAAAIAALHERSLLEGKIKGLRFHQPLNNYQRVAEHDYVSHRADEEREKRPQYRPIIEHDGLPRLKVSNEETSKTKTREELLAEERDYKRRRMSYRAKKVKRANLEVMRDIIEDFMDEIKQAGGIGCFEKGTKAEDTLLLKPSYASEITSDINMSKKGNYDSSAAGDSPDRHRKQSRSGFGAHATTFKGYTHKDYEQTKRGLYGDHEPMDDQRSISRDKRDREYYSRSPRHDRSSDWTHHRREQNEREGSGTKRHESKHSSSRKPKYCVNRLSTFGLTSEHKSKSKDRHHSDRYENRSSELFLRNTFEDRYEPSESHDTHEDDIPTNSKDVRGDKFVDGK